MRKIVFQMRIFSLANNFLRWTCFGLIRFRHRWTTSNRATLRISNTTDKQNNWLADVTPNWCHVMEMAFERNNQPHRFITFLHRLFYKIYMKTSQIMNKNVVKTKSFETHFIFLTFVKVWMQWVRCTILIVFILLWMSEKWDIFLKGFLENIQSNLSQAFGRSLA